MRWGMFRLRALVDGRRTGPERGVYFARRAVPLAVKEHFRHPRTGKLQAVLVRSTGETSFKTASLIAEEIWRGWGAEFAAALQVGSSPIITTEAAIAAIDRWRAMECGLAAGAERRRKHEAAQAAILADYKTAITTGTYPGSDEVIILKPGSPADLSTPHAPIAGDFLTWAKEYFDLHPHASRSIERPHAVSTLLERLQGATWEPMAWVKVPGFDEALDGAVAAGGALGALTPVTREKIRPAFARAFFEVERHREAERSRAASFLAALSISSLTGSQLVVTPGSGAYQPREGDRTVKEVIAMFKLSKGRDAGLLEKTHGYVFRALEELFGPEKPLRAVTRQDVRDLLEFLATLPSNSSKIYPGVDLREAAKRGAADGKPTLAPNTIRSYAISLKGLFAFAMADGWADSNPVDGLTPTKLNKIKRKAFAKEQLDVLFGALTKRRAANSAYWWVPAILAFHGARANEISQLFVEDVKEVDGVAYLDMTYFDDDGELLDRRTLKTRPSERCLPIHDELVAAGFLDFVEMRRATGEERLFGDLRLSGRGYWTHELSKWWGRHCDACGYPEKAFVLHSLRHGWKDSATANGLSDTVINAIGGWGAESEREKYGDQRTRAKVPENAIFLNRVTLGGFKLGPPRSVPEPI